MSAVTHKPMQPDQREAMRQIVARAEALRVAIESVDHKDDHNTRQALHHVRKAVWWSATGIRERGMKPYEADTQ